MNASLWKLEEVERLLKLLREGVPTSIASMHLGRSIDEVEAKAAELGVGSHPQGEPVAMPKGARESVHRA